MRIHPFEVTPALPGNLEPLREIAVNLRWSWDHESIELFRRISKGLWEEAGHNPVRMLGAVDQGRLDQLSRDEGFLAHLGRVHADLRLHLERPGWTRGRCPGPPGACIAYFSAEFGITECMPIYSGGLGILAADHLKAASELGLPLVGVGLLYQKGYFEQYLTPDGWQQERYPINDFHNLPITLERLPGGEPLRVRVEMADHLVAARVWRAQVGRIPLYLLDTNIPDNDPADQDITDELYGGDGDLRIRQELILGVGGLRALKALGLRPTVCHLNEGHSAFLALERMREEIAEHGLAPEEARLAVEAGNVFTTHTPVPAGIDVFPLRLAETYLAPYARLLGLESRELLALGADPHADGFSMAALAIRMAARINGVSRLHGRVARRMFAHLWPGAPEEEIPITHITNGIHVRSWISHEMASLYDRYLGPRWTEDPADQTVWNGVEEIPDSELWSTHERRRERLVAFARRTLARQLERRGAPDAALALAREVLDPEALTIGFARRFAPYKRAALLFRDLERLTRLLDQPGRPVQILFAGKAHPRDERGKALIREIVGHTRHERLRRHIVFLENYDTSLARYLVAGVDVWLNTPRRPREASGTSGMKAAVNGALNLSILDGWWDEAYARKIGWAIGRGEEYADEEQQDRVESRALYDILENDVVPLFYSRGVDGIPREWTARMRAAMRALCPVHNTNRMVCQYMLEHYQVCAERYARLTADGGARLRALAAWERRVRGAWGEVRAWDVSAAGTGAASVGGEIRVACSVALGSLAPADVAVQVYHGRLDEHGRI
ncbi:MAG: alpha-glucan family phosphorylase, partial [Candidatus Eisenbacteria bacterium]|nr:alpha-glucan family phosphorylase [Candidatus Eisenbacteria bacterium]